MTEYGKVVITSFLITTLVYVFPILLLRIDGGPMNRSDSNKIAATYSILIGIGFIFFRSSNNISGSSSSYAPFIYFFVNRALLRFGYQKSSNFEESSIESGAGVFVLKDENNKENTSLTSSKSMQDDGGSNIKDLESKVDKSNSLEDYKKLYKSLNKEIGSMVFPGGFSDFEAVLSSLDYIFDNQFSLEELAVIYTRTFVRIVQSEPDEVANRIKENGELKGFENKIEYLVAFIMMHKTNIKYKIKNHEDFQELVMFANSLSVNSKYKEINDQKIKEFINDEDYGKVLNKPIYVNGYKGSENFLKDLRSIDGNGFKHKRKGSIALNSGSTDIYEIENKSSHEKSMIFINLYSNNKNYYPPKGFILASTTKDKEENINPLNDIEKTIEPVVVGMNDVKPTESTKNEVEDSLDITCSKCHTINPEGSKYCHKCGLTLEFPKSKVFCSNCGTKLIENSEFCHKCGKSVNRVQI